MIPNSDIQVIKGDKGTVSAMTLRMQRECEMATGEEGCADFRGAIQGVSQGALRMRKALLPQTQAADCTPQDALRLPEQEAALRETVRQMEHLLQENNENIRALRQELDVRMRGVERRLDFLEEQFRRFQGIEEREEGVRQGSKELLERDGVKTSAESSLGTVFPRVDALVAELEKRLPLGVPCALPSAACSSSVSSHSSDAGSSHLRPPSLSAVGATATKPEAAGARKEPASSCQPARTTKQERERQQEELRLRQASAKVERALAALGLA
ncbi:Protein of unknown function [Gryllus bimaculatus]|nr:Protein of unknown function [Gryllus bimaculatus]